MLTLDHKAKREIDRALSYIEGAVDANHDMDGNDKQSIQETLSVIYKLLDAAEDKAEAAGS